MKAKKVFVFGISIFLAGSTCVMAADSAVRERESNTASVKVIAEQFTGKFQPYLKSAGKDSEVASMKLVAGEKEYELEMSAETSYVNVVKGTIGHVFYNGEYRVVGELKKDIIKVISVECMVSGETKVGTYDKRWYRVR